MALENGVNVEGVARASMLRAAGAWLSMGQTNQAAGICLKILREYPGSREAEEAKAMLLGLAATFERNACYRQSMDLYDKIERASE